MSLFKFILILIILSVYSCKTSKTTIEMCLFYPISEKSCEFASDSIVFNLSSRLACDSLHIQFTNLTTQNYYLYTSLLCEENFKFEEIYTIDTINKMVTIDLTKYSKLNNSMKKIYWNHRELKQNRIYNIAFKTNELLQNFHKEGYILTIELTIVTNMNRCHSLIFFSDIRETEVLFDCLK